MADYRRTEGNPTVVGWYWVPWAGPIRLPEKYESTELGRGTQDFMLNRYLFSVEPQ